MMNAARMRELLTAAVDGELTPAEWAAAQRLLRGSEAARALYAQLKSDAARLKNLPRIAAPGDLVESVQTTIRDRAMTPTPLPPSRKRDRQWNWSSLPIWANVATAASLFLAISVGSYLYFVTSQDYKQRQQIVRAPSPSNNSEPGPDAPDGALPALVDHKDVNPRPEQIVPSPEVIAARPREVGPEIGPEPREVRADVITGPVPDQMPEIESFQLDKIRVSNLFTLHDLPGDEAARKKLAAEMSKDELIRLDLFCQSTPHALELIQSVLKARGILAITDGFVLELLRKKTQPEIVIFTEAMTPDEVVQFLSTLGAQDKKGAAELGTLVAAPFLPADLMRLSRLLGIPSLEPRPAKGKAGIDIRKPLPEGTANEVAAALSRLGGTPSPKKGKSALVVSYSPINPQPAASREIRQFLDGRGDRRPNAKPLMLVLRTTK